MDSLDPFGLAACAKTKRDATAAKPHVFWSGGRTVMKAAAEWAQEHGAVTLEMTARGAKAGRWAKNLAWVEARPIWVKQSRAFAKEAQGDVTIFATRDALRNKASILNEIEIPALNAKKANILYKIID
jgi:hypothetical protein